ncbi:hypothetical protein ACHHYP_03443 [Achlya hypogyna]|uniref:CW-type domain-containing protein n=1 Tax=Achlya hypogyna TaxID=1202772 RepID=A0A1V9ZR66_ACHHY|nr:hypothetical protein ACHHYP_03443 [Achlya hypogyna]
MEDDDGSGILRVGMGPSSPRVQMRGGWAKEPLVAERLDVYLLRWDTATQSAPDVFDTTTRKPKDESEIVVRFQACIKYHDTTLTRMQFIKEYGELPRTRNEEVLRLREALVEQYCIDQDMEAKKAEVLRSDDSWMDEADAVVPTALRQPKLSPADRLKHITSLWPTNMPNFKDPDESLDYYGFEVGIYLESEKVKDEAAEETEKTDDSEADIAPETPQPIAMGHTSKEENWVQCDKCQKWRKLPDSVDVSELPAIWYCRMNKWSRRFNKCSAAEETTVMPLKDTDLKSLQERKFVHQFAQRLKRMEKAMQDLKYTDPKDDDGTRKFVQCQVCHKKRPLLAGMDPAKVHQPFVCWMNGWDELHASCSAPQGALLERDADVSTEAARTKKPKEAKDKDVAKRAEKDGVRKPDKENGRKPEKDPAKKRDADKERKEVKKADKAAKSKTKAPPTAPPPLYSSSDEEVKSKPAKRKPPSKDKAAARKKVKK